MGKVDWQGSSPGLGWWGASAVCLVLALPGTLAPAAWRRECLPCPWKGGRGGSYDPERVGSGRESFGGGDHTTVSPFLVRQVMMGAELLQMFSTQLYVETVLG